MASRAVWLAFVLLGSAGCSNDPYYYMYREPCDASPEDCCPPGAHEVYELIPPVTSGRRPFLDIICVWDDAPCADAGADADACQEAGTDAP